jgi:thiamine-monophosphate kinase
MNVAGYGEDRLVADLTRGLGAVGDDCAVLEGERRGRLRLLKVDAVVEGIHFLRKTDPALVGRKAMARPLSDIAAMGGLPMEALVTVGLPGDRPVEEVVRLYDGLRRIGDAYGVSVVGGETVRTTGPLFLSVALTGWVERRRVVRRSGGGPGDWLYVTGMLGGSISGRHLAFEPRIGEARWLTEHFRIAAMMDLSDGLGADLPRLARASGTGFEIDRAALPLAPGCDADAALGDGEDYELLFAVAARAGRKLEVAWPPAFPEVRLTRIGRLTGVAPGGVKWVKGYDHFA